MRAGVDCMRNRCPIEGLLVFLLNASKYMSEDQLESARRGLFQVIEAYRDEIAAKRAKPYAVLLKLPVKGDSQGDPERL